MRKLTKYIDIQRQQEMNHVKHAANYVKVRMWFFDFWRASVHAKHPVCQGELSDATHAFCLFYILVLFNSDIVHKHDDIEYKSMYSIYPTLRGLIKHIRTKQQLIRYCSHFIQTVASTVTSLSGHAPNWECLFNSTCKTINGESVHFEGHYSFAKDIDKIDIFCCVRFPPRCSPIGSF